MSENSCYTYFRITGDFDPDYITERLGLQPQKTWKTGDLRPDGSAYEFSSWKFGQCDEYDVITENQMHKTIEPLFDKAWILNQIKDEYDVYYSLEIVPTVYTNNICPTLSPSMKVIDFCHATRTEIDIDLYVMEQD